MELPESTKQKRQSTGSISTGQHRRAAPTKTRVQVDFRWQLRGYNIYVHPNNNNHSGCVTVVRTSIPHRRITRPINCGRDVEVIAVLLQLPTTDLLVYNIYRKPPRTLQAERLFVHLAAHPGIVAGDFNAHHPVLNSTSAANPTGNHLARLMEDLPSINLLNSGEPSWEEG